MVEQSQPGYNSSLNSNDSNKLNRQRLLCKWATEKLDFHGFEFDTPLELIPVSDDASFRRYFRATHRGKNLQSGFIFVDAPPENEDSASFVKVAELISGVNVLVPKVVEYDLKLGFMMLNDLGDRLYLDVLRSDETHAISDLYPAAFNVLQKFIGIDCRTLPEYGEALLRSEMNLFPEWLLAEQLEWKPDSTTTNMLSAVLELMVYNAKEQPEVFVHRDFHSRNLMSCDENIPGVIDFQDAVKGPITYDLVSLLKDCYWCFPRAQVLRWVKSYWQVLGLEVEFPQFLRWFDLMGMQRQIKCAGIFCRLSIRDGKPGYLADIPQVVHYLVEVCELYKGQYKELETFGNWLDQEFIPRMKVRIDLTPNR